MIQSVFDQLKKKTQDIPALPAEQNKIKDCAKNFQKLRHGIIPEISATKPDVSTRQLVERKNLDFNDVQCPNTCVRNFVDQVVTIQLPGFTFKCGKNGMFGPDLAKCLSLYNVNWVNYYKRCKRNKKILKFFEDFFFF